MMSITSVLCVTIVFLNLSQYDTKTIQKDSDKATNITMTNTNTTKQSLVNKFFDLDGMHNFFPNLNDGVVSPLAIFPKYPRNGNQFNDPNYSGINFNNFNGGHYPVYPDTPQVNPNYPGTDFNNFNGGHYPESPDTPQLNNPQLPGYDFNNVNNGGYPVNPNTPHANDNQYYPGNGLDLNGANYPVHPDIPQDHNPHYPGNDFSNLNGGYQLNPNIPQLNNFEYPGNDFNNLNGGNNPVNPDIPQENYPRYPGAGSNLDYNNKWSNHGYPVNYEDALLYPDEQGQYPGSDSSWNTNNGLQNEQNPNIIVFPDQVKEVPQAQTPGLYQGPPPDPQGILPGFQIGGSFNPQDSNGLDYLPNGNLHKPLLQYPQITRPVITTSTTEKVAILGLPVSVPYETTQTPFVTKSTSSAMKQCVQDCPSTTEYNPVCGSNNVTYFNEQKMECARFCGIDVTVIKNGACADGPSPGIFG